MGALVGLTTLFAAPAAPFMSRRRTLSIASWWARMNLRLLHAIVGISVEIRGREHIPNGAALIAVKHQSALETFSLMPELRDPAFVLKRELLAIPFFGWFLKRLEMIALNREAGSDALKQLITQAEKAAKAGRQVVIYPEGTRRAVGDPPIYKSGVALLYKRMNRPCVPVAINTGVFWPKSSTGWRRGRAVIEFLEPIPAGLDRATFERALRTRIETASEALVAEALAAESLECQEHLGPTSID